MGNEIPFLFCTQSIRLRLTLRLNISDCVALAPILLALLQKGVLKTLPTSRHLALNFTITLDNFCVAYDGKQIIISSFSSTSSLCLGNMDKTRLLATSHTGVSLAKHGMTYLRSCALIGYYLRRKAFLKWGYFSRVLSLRHFLISFSNSSYSSKIHLAVWRECLLVGDTD